MTFAKRNLALVAAILLAVGAASVARAADATGVKLSADEILQKARETYASLTNYSDEGKTLATVNGMTATITFSVRLARPNLYKIEWDQDIGAPLATNKANAVWSAGAGNFLDMGRGVQEPPTQEIALKGATSPSGGAAATIPGTFFNMNWGNQLGNKLATEKQQDDEKLDGVDCYVFASESQGRTKTMWIGKQDFLIRQVRNVTSAAAMKAALAYAAKSNPGVMMRPPPIMGDIITTETHTRILVNQKLSPSDFAR